MRHDFCSANVQMFHLIEHRTENDELRAGTDKLLNLLRTFRGATPDRYAWSEIGIFVTPCKPLPNASFSPLLITIDTEIDSLAITESRRITLRIGKKLANHLRLTNEGTGGRRARSHPSVAVLHRPFERIFVVAAEPQGQVRLLDRLRFHRNTFKIPISSLKTRLRFGPEELHDLYSLSKARHAPFARVTEHIFMRPKMTAAEPNSHDSTTATHH